MTVELVSKICTFDKSFILSVLIGTDKNFEVIILSLFCYLTFVGEKERNLD